MPRIDVYLVVMASWRSFECVASEAYTIDVQLCKRASNGHVVHQVRSGAVTSQIDMHGPPRAWPEQPGPVVAV